MQLDPRRTKMPALDGKVREHVVRELLTYRAAAEVKGH